MVDEKLTQPNIFRPTTREELFHPISSHVAPIFAFEGEKHLIAGSVVLIAPNFAVTAKHVMKYIFKEFGIKVADKKGVSLDIYIHQLSVGCVWYVSQTFEWVGTDIVLLRLNPRNDEAKKYEVKRLPMTVDPPNEGSLITALGYPASKMSLKRNDSEVTEVELSLTPVISTGKVLDVHRSYRDSGMLNFPCFTVDAKFPSGMSGGAVFNEKKELCGLVCSGNEGETEADSAYSNAVSIWPIMIIPVTLKPNEYNPLNLEIGKGYKVFDLVKEGHFNFSGHDRIEFFKHENGSDGVRRKHF